VTDRELANVLASALRLLLDQVDYTTGACRPTEMVGAVLPQAVLTVAHAAKEKAREHGV
jgi:hypothetical protein